jgi:hypothetical protein
VVNYESNAPDVIRCYRQALSSDDVENIHDLV